MSKKITTQEKFENVQRDMQEGRFSTIELACKAHKISPASYHIYRNRVGTSASPVKQSQGPVERVYTRSNGPEDVSSLKLKIEILQSRIQDLEAQNTKMRETLMTFLK